MAVRTSLTHSEYLRLPEDDHTKYEMLWGTLYMAASPRVTHQAAQASLIALLDHHVRPSGGRVLGPIDLYRDEVNYVQPDLSYFTAEQYARIRDEQTVREVPPLVVEILSPSTAAYDRTTKRDWYTERGVREYWLVDPMAQRVTVIDLQTGETRDKDPVRSAVLPDLTLTLAEIFA